MFLLINDVNYYLEVVGEGEPLLLLHGFTGSAKNWNPFIEQWSKDYKLIAVDLLGHGQTDHPTDYHRYSTENAVRDLLALLNHFEIEKTNIIGYSMGGRLALSFAALYPERVQSLILESSSPGLVSKKEQLARKASDNILADKIEQDNMEAFINYWENLPLFKSQEQSLPADVKKHLRSERLKNNKQGLANSLRGMGTGVQPSWWENLHALEIPVLLVVGERDEKFCKINQLMNKSLPKSNFLVVKDAGHTIHMEQPEFFGKIVMDYLKGGNKYGSGVGSKTTI